MVIFRQTAQLDQAEREITSLLLSYQNKARNSVVSESLYATTGDKIAAKADGFAFYFDNSTGAVTVRYCIRPGGSTSYNCSGVEVANPIPPELGMIKFTSGGGSCSGILFKRVSGDISAMSAITAVPSDTVPVCVLTITHVEAGRTRTMNIDVARNVID